jgi:hypothetical protein
MKNALNLPKQHFCCKQGLSNSYQKNYQTVSFRTNSLLHFFEKNGI